MTREDVEFMCALDAGQIDYKKVWKRADCSPIGVVPCISLGEAENVGIPGSQNWGSSPPTSILGKGKHGTK